MRQYLQTLQFNRGQIAHRLAFALLLVVSLVSVLRAQSTGASLTGHITDPSKALIVDAKIAAINQRARISFMKPRSMTSMTACTAETAVCERMTQLATR